MLVSLSLLILPLLLKGTINKQPRLVKTFYLFIGFAFSIALDETIFGVASMIVWSVMIRLFTADSTQSLVNKNIGHVVTAIMLTLYTIFLLNNCTTLMHLFVCVEILLIISVYFLVAEKNVNQHAVFYIIPNLVLGVVFLIGFLCVCMTTDSRLAFSFLCLLKDNDIGTPLLDLGFLLIGLVIIGKLGAYPVLFILPQVYSNLSAPSVVFFSIGLVPPYLLVFLNCVSFIPSFILSFLYVIVGFSLVMGCLSVFFTSTINHLLAGLSIMNNNLLLVLILGMPFDGAADCQDFFMGYVLSISAFYSQFVSLNVNTSLHSFLSMLTHFNSVYYLCMLGTLLILSGFPGFLLFVIKIHIVGVSIFTNSFLLFLFCYFITSFFLYLTLLGLSFSTIERLNATSELSQPAPFAIKDTCTVFETIFGLLNFLPLVIDIFN